MQLRTALVAVLASIPAFAVGCASPAGDDSASGSEAAYTSASATLLDFEFDGELTTVGSDAKSAIHDQLLFTIGQFNGEVGVGRLDKVALTDVKTEKVDGLNRIRYHAKLPVSLAKTAAVGQSYTLLLPRRVDGTGQNAFFQKYEKKCTDWAAHDNSPGIYWYYYRPRLANCSLDAADIVKATATVKKSPENSENTYPEYDQIWKDDVLNVVAIFGKVEDFTTTESDRGIWSHSHFVSSLRSTLPNAKVTPAQTPDRPGVQYPDVTIESTLANGKKVKVTSFLVDNVRNGGAAFEQRYNALSGDADVIVYNGHAGLGDNVRALVRMGTFKKAKYQLVYMNGCDTFAYVDGYLAESRAVLNPDDPTGTKYLEILTNAMPPNWDSLPNNTLSLIADLMKVDAPLKYKDILGHFDQSGFVAVTGDEDNKFKP